MRVRGSHRPLLTLFAFQDVVMSVTGIMLVLMLLLSLELASRESPAPATTAASTAETLQKQLAAARQIRDELQHSLQAADALLQGAEVNPHELRGEIAAVETEIRSLHSELRDLREQRQRLEQELQATTARRANLPSLQTEVEALKTRAEEWTESLPRDAVYLLLLVQPSGVERFRSLQPVLTKRGIPHGFDVVAEHQTPLHPERGAAP